MIFQIRFTGRITDRIFREPYVIGQWPESEKEAAMVEWREKFSLDKDAYEFLCLLEPEKWMENVGDKDE